MVSEFRSDEFVICVTFPTQNSNKIFCFKKRRLECPIYGKMLNRVQNFLKVGVVKYTSGARSTVWEYWLLLRGVIIIFFCRSVRFLKILPGNVYSISRSDIPLFLRWYFLKYPYLLMHRGGAIPRAILAWCLFCCILRSFLHVSAGNDDLFLFKRTNFAVKSFFG